MTRDRVPSAPFQKWLNERFDVLSEKHRCDSAARYNLCQEIGWPPTDSNLRKLFRHRRAITDRSKGPRGARTVRWSEHTDWFRRDVVEDALHHAGVDFYDVYPEYAYERDVKLEPDGWCETCKGAVTPIDGDCPWDGTRVSQFAGTPGASSQFAGTMAA